MVTETDTRPVHFVHHDVARPIADDGRLERAAEVSKHAVHVAERVAPEVLSETDDHDLEHLHVREGVLVPQ
jgi:hypothetical protein